MTGKPSVTEVRARVRTRSTGELLLLAGAFQNVEFGGSPPPGALRRFNAMREEVLAELDRRGVAVIPDPAAEAVCIATYVGDAKAVRGGGERA